MARNFRFLGKKRGDRHTGSPRLGGVGEALFFGVLFLLGAVSLAYLIASRLTIVPSTPYTPGFGFWLMVLATASFTVLGGGGVIYTVLNLETSAERRSAMVRRASSIDLISDALGPGREYPGIPKDTNITNSPGVRLDYRLPVSRGTVWALLAASVFFLACSAVTIVLVTIAVRGHMAGAADWPASLLATLFLGLCGWAIYYFVRQLISHTGLGPTTVEISAHPLIPGARYRYYLCQPGRLRDSRLVVDLVCQEETTFQQGTDIQTGQCPVFQHEILVRADVTISPGIPFEYEGQLSVPADAMHSLQTSHNAIRWMLVVRCMPRKGPAFERRFPVVVYPPQPAREAD